MGNEDISWAAVGSWKEEPAFFDGAQTRTGCCEEDSITEGIMASYPLWDGMGGGGGQES